MTPPANHVAVVRPQYLQAILDGRKTIESRFMKTRREPFQRVTPGDHIYFRAPGSPYAARAIIAQALHIADLTPAAIETLKARHNQHILAPDEYWATRRNARYATLVWLEQVQPTSTGPALPPLFGRGWAVVAKQTNHQHA